ncbi:hypothetical protein D3C80_1669890 [compost metagenome]
MDPFGNLTAMVMPSPSSKARVLEKNTSFPSVMTCASVPVSPAAPVKTAVSLAFTL